MPAPLHERIVRMPFRLLSMHAAFRHYYFAESWGDGEESISGPGSSMEHTEVVRRELPRMLRQVNARTLLDIPCGDFYWMRHVDLPVQEYIGADIVEELIALNQQRYGSSGRRFEVLDLTQDPLPRVDVVLCRDCLVHLSLCKAVRAVRNIIESGSTWLLATTFPGAVKQNRNILTGGWRMLDLTLPPFSFPQPVVEIDEEWPEWPLRRLGFWRIADLVQGHPGAKRLMKHVKSSTVRAGAVVEPSQLA